MVGLWVLAVVLGLLVLGCVRPPNLRLDVVDGALRVRVGPLDRLLTTRLQIQVPLALVEGVVAASASTVPRTGMRLPGTSLPGIVRAGSYGSGRHRDFWDVRRGDTYLVVQCREGAPYRRLVLEVPDAHAEALRLRPLVGAHAGTFEA